MTPVDMGDLNVAEEVPLLRKDAKMELLVALLALDFLKPFVRAFHRESPSRQSPECGST